MGEQFDFGTALARLKDGQRVQRAGWNDKDMFIWLYNGYGAETVEPGMASSLPILPCICRKTADNKALYG